MSVTALFLRQLDALDAQLTVAKAMVEAMRNQLTGSTASAPPLPEKCQRESPEFCARQFAAAGVPPNGTTTDRICRGCAEVLTV